MSGPPALPPRDDEDPFADESVRVPTRLSGRGGSQRRPPPAMRGRGGTSPIRRGAAPRGRGAAPRGRGSPVPRTASPPSQDDNPFADPSISAPPVLRPPPGRRPPPAKSPTDDDDPFADPSTLPAPSRKTPSNNSKPPVAAPRNPPPRRAPRPIDDDDPFADPAISAPPPRVSPASRPKPKAPVDEENPFDEISNFTAPARGGAIGGGRASGVRGRGAPVRKRGGGTPKTMASILMDSPPENSNSSSPASLPPAGLPSLPPSSLPSAPPPSSLPAMPPPSSLPAMPPSSLPSKPPASLPATPPSSLPPPPSSLPSAPPPSSLPAMPPSSLPSKPPSSLPAAPSSLPPASLPPSRGRTAPLTGPPSGLPSLPAANSLPSRTQGPRDILDSVSMMAMVVEEYRSSNPAVELDLDVDDTIFILDITTDSMFYGRNMSGSCGKFPMHCVEIMQLLEELGMQNYLLEAVKPAGATSTEPVAKATSHYRRQRTASNKVAMVGRGRANLPQQHQQRKPGMQLPGMQQMPPMSPQQQQMFQQQQQNARTGQVKGDVKMKRSGSMPKMSGFLGREKRKSNYKQGSQIDHQEMPGMGSDSAESPSTPRKKDKKDKKKDKDKEDKDINAIPPGMEGITFLNHSDNPTPQPQVPATPPKKKTKEDLRRDCLLELLETERQYVDDLETMISVFVLPLRIQKTTTDSVMYNIFSNLELLIGCNKEFLIKLEERLGDGQFENPNVLIGDVFVGMADYFKMYKVYCANQQTSLDTVEKEKKNKSFKAYLEVCHSDPRLKGLFLQSYLIKPIQRVCKYPLLLREIIKNTPEDAKDYQNLTAAFDKINAVVGDINEAQRNWEGLQHIIELQNKIEGCPKVRITQKCDKKLFFPANGIDLVHISLGYGLLQELVAPGRQLHMQGDLKYHRNQKSKGETRHIFLFSDMMLLTISKGAERWEHKLTVSLDNCKLIVLADQGPIKNGFEMKQELLKQKCIISTAEIDESQKWVKEIKLLIKEFQKKKLRELKEAKRKEEMAARGELPSGLISLHEAAGGMSSTDSDGEEGTLNRRGSSGMHDASPSPKTNPNLAYALAPNRPRSSYG